MPHDVPESVTDQVLHHTQAACELAAVAVVAAAAAVEIVGRDLPLQLVVESMLAGASSRLSASLLSLPVPM